MRLVDNHNTCSVQVLVPYSDSRDAPAVYTGAGEATQFVHFLLFLYRKYHAMHYYGTFTVYVPLRTGTVLVPE